MRGAGQGALVGQARVQSWLGWGEAGGQGEGGVGLGGRGRPGFRMGGVGQCGKLGGVGWAG